MSLFVCNFHYTLLPAVCQTAPHAVAILIRGCSGNLFKFPTHIDGRNAGKMEYNYSCCARQCGITMSETRLFPSNKCEGYFGTKRFDRIVDKTGKKRIHMLTAAALLELDFEQPSLDYHSLMKLTKILTRDNPEDLRNMFRRMCFNVYAHNRDGHSKNEPNCRLCKTDKN